MFTKAAFREILLITHSFERSVYFIFMRILIFFTVTVYVDLEL